MSVLSEAFGVDSLPAGWETSPLHAVATERRGNKNDGLLEENLLSLSYGSIVRKDINSDGGLLPESFEGYQIVEAGDLVMRLTDLQNDKRSLRSGLCKERGIITSAYLALEPRGIDPRYFAYLMRAYDTAKVLYPLGGGLRQSLKFEDVRMLPVLVPPVEEQRRIVDFLDDQVARIEAVIDRIESAEALSAQRWDEQLRSAVFGLETCSPSRSASDLQSSSTHGEHGLLGIDLPAGWTWAKLNRIARLGTGHTPDRNRSEYWEECFIPWVTAADLSKRPDPFAPLQTTTQHISELGLANSAAVLHPANTVMLCRTASVGLFCITSVPMATTQAFVTWTPLDDLQARYLLYLIAAYASEFDRLAYGSTHRTIYMPDLEALRIPLPSMRDQESIVKRLDNLNEQRIALSVCRRQLTELLEERKRALITAAVTGEMDVTTASPIGVGKLVSNVGAGVEAPAAAQASSSGGIG